MEGYGEVTGIIEESLYLKRLLQKSQKKLSCHSEPVEL